jgi:hypothetical protein
MSFLGGSLSTTTQAAAVSALGNEAFVAENNSDAAVNHFVIPGLGAIGADTLDLTALLSGVSPSVLDSATNLSALVSVAASTGSGTNWHTTVTIQNGLDHAQVVLGTSTSISTGIGSNGLTNLYPALVLPPH